MHFEKAPVRMQLIKPANPGLAGLPHKSLREPFGIPAHHNVLSFYFKYPEGNTANYKEAPSMGVMAKALINQYSKAGKRAPDIIFATFGGRESVSATQAFGENFQGYEFIKLSEWSQKYHPSRKFIVANDLKGRMPHILNVSDLSVVSGPINIMEPLSAGTPLLFFNNPSVITDYDPKAFNTFADHAIKTGGAWQLRSLEDLQSVFAQAVSKPSSEIIPPFLLPSGNMLGTPVDQLIQEIISNIQKSMQIIEDVRANPPGR